MTDTFTADSEDQPNRAKRGKATMILSWAVLALFIGLIADFAEPVGALALWLFLIGLVALLLAYLVQKKGPNFIPFAGVFTAIMAIILLLQLFASPEARGEDRGFLGSNLSPVASLQTAILPLSPNNRQLLQFGNRTNRGSDIERVEAARALYENSDDAMVRQTMLERMMQSDNAALIQTAMLLRLAEREGDMLKLVPLEADGDGILARRLESYAFRLLSVNVDSGALKLEGNAPSAGKVDRTRIDMELYIAILGKPNLMQVELQPSAEMKLTGTAELQTGENVAVEMPLF